MIEFYYWPTPNGHKIAIALEEMNLEYTVHPVNILKGEQHETAFKQINPNNRIPVIVDHKSIDGKQFPIFESGAILLYLAQKSGRFWPSDAVTQSIVTQWLFFQAANVGPMFGQCGFFNNYSKVRVELGIVRYCGETRRLYRLLDGQLAEKEWIAGSEYSLADMAHYPWMERRQQDLHGIDIVEFPNVARWIDAVEKRPAVQRGTSILKDAMQVGNPSEETYRHFFGQRDQ